MAIEAGTELRAATEAEIFEDFSAVNVIRMCRPGDIVVATGTPVESSGFLMVPIEPDGAVELESFEKVLRQQRRSVVSMDKQASERKRPTLTLSQVETVLMKTLQASRLVSDELTIKTSFAAWKQLGFNRQLQKEADEGCAKSENQDLGFNRQLQKEADGDQRRLEDQGLMQKRLKKKMQKSPVLIQKKTNKRAQEGDQQMQIESAELQQVRAALRETRSKVQELRAGFSEKLQIMTRKLTEGDDLISKLHCFNVLRTTCHATALKCAQSATCKAEDMQRYESVKHLTDGNSCIVQLRCFGAWRVGALILSRERSDLQKLKSRASLVGSRRTSLEEPSNSKGSKATFVKAHEFEQLRAQLQDQQGGLQKLLAEKVAGPTDIQQVQAQLEEQRGDLRKLLTVVNERPQVQAQLEEQRSDMQKLLTVINERPQKQIHSQPAHIRLRQVSVNLVDAFSERLVLQCLLSWRMFVLRVNSKRLWRQSQQQLEQESSRQHHTEQQLRHAMLTRKGFIERVAQVWQMSIFYTLLQRILSLWHVHVVEILSKRSLKSARHHVKQSHEQLEQESSRQQHAEQQLRLAMLSRKGFAERVAQVWQSSFFSILLQRILSLWNLYVVQMFSKRSLDCARHEYDVNMGELSTQAKCQMMAITETISARSQGYASSKLLRFCTHAWAVCALATVALTEADRNIQSCRVARRQRVYAVLSFIGGHRRKKADRDLLRCCSCAWRTCVHFVAALYQLEHALCEKSQPLQRRSQQRNEKRSSERILQHQHDAERQSASRVLSNTWYDADVKSMSALHALVDDLQRENASLHASLLCQSDPKVKSFGQRPAAKFDGAHTPPRRQSKSDLTSGRAVSAPRRVRKAAAVDDVSGPRQSKTSVNSRILRLAEQPHAAGSKPEATATLNSKILALQSLPASSNMEVNETMGSGRSLLQNVEERFPAGKKTDGAVDEEFRDVNKVDAAADEIEKIPKTRGSLFEESVDDADKSNASVDEVAKKPYTDVDEDLHF